MLPEIEIATPNIDVFIYHVSNIHHMTTSSKLVFQEIKRGENSKRHCRKNKHKVAALKIVEKQCYDD